MASDPKQPAFPVVLPFEYHGAESGMTLRDWFAGQALNGWLATYAESEGPSPALLATFCYNLAEAMIAEKARRDD